MLLYDLNEYTLLNDMGIKNIHAKQIIRAIYELKKFVRSIDDQLYDISTKTNFHYQDSEIQNELEILKEELIKQVELKKELKDYYEKEILKLKDQIKQFEITIEENKKQLQSNASQMMFPTLSNTSNSSISLNTNTLLMAITSMQNLPIELQQWLDSILMKKKEKKK